MLVISESIKLSPEMALVLLSAHLKENTYLLILGMEAQLSG